MFVMLNPSTADEQRDDLTIKKCIGFSSRWGYGGLAVVNLFAYRTPYPRELDSVGAEAAIGERNDYWTRRTLNGLFDADAAPAVTSMIVAAWGHSRVQLRHNRIIDFLEIWAGIVPEIPIRCLGTTRNGHPRHPSRLAYNTELVPWDPDAPTAA